MLMQAMEISKTISRVGVFLLLLSLYHCGTTHSLPPQDFHSTKLNNMKAAIQELADSSICTNDTQCRSIAFGSKPCGGPRTYLVYSSSIDTARLATLVEDYNKLEMRINQERGLISDCGFVTPPQVLRCSNNKCVAIY